MPIQLHILCAGNDVSIEQLSNSLLASDRLRLAPAAKAAHEAGMKLTIGDNIPVTADAVLVGKLGTYQIEIRQPKWLAQLNRFSQAGGAVIADYTDHHIAIRSKQSSFYRELLEIAHLLITPSESMKAQLSASLDTLVHVIGQVGVWGLPQRIQRTTAIRSYGSATNRT